MSAPHRIRLHGPWEVHTQVSGFTSGRMTIPGILRDGGWEGYEGAVTFVRRFGRPTNLGTGDVVQLAIDGFVGRALVLLNDEFLGPLERSARWNVTEFLFERNALQLMFQAATGDCGITGEVVLEIVAG